MHVMVPVKGSENYLDCIFLCVRVILQLFVQLMQLQPVFVAFAFSNWQSYQAAYKNLTLLNSDENR